ncbi:MAG: twin-arginine translocase TatA/TatE family subunit [Candidatus Limnocylindria bacterium]
MPTPGPVELIIILVIALIILGPGRLPDVGSALGKSIREFRKASSDIQESVKVDVSTTPGAAPPAPSTQPAAPAQPTPPAPAPQADASAEPAIPQPGVAPTAADLPGAPTVATTSPDAESASDDRHGSV